MSGISLLFLFRNRPPTGAQTPCAQREITVHHSCRALRRNGPLCLLLRHNLLDFLDEQIEKLVFAAATHRLALAEQGALTAPAGNAHVGIARLAGAIYNASHHGDLHWFLDALQVTLNAFRQLDELNFAATARWAGNKASGRVPAGRAL